MFKKLFSADLPAAKAYHAVSLEASGNPELAEIIRAGDQGKFQDIPTPAEVFARGIWNLLRRVVPDYPPVDLTPFNSPLLRRE